MNVACIIPARYASTRLPGKPLLDIAGKPMIQHVVERVRQARRSSRIDRGHRRCAYFRRSDGVRRRSAHDFRLASHRHGPVGGSRRGPAGTSTWS